MSESPLFILSTARNTVNKSIFQNYLSHFVQSVQEWILEFKIVTTDTRKWRVKLEHAWGRERVLRKQMGHRQQSRWGVGKEGENKPNQWTWVTYSFLHQISEVQRYCFCSSRAYRWLEQKTYTLHYCPAHTTPPQQCYHLHKQHPSLKFFLMKKISGHKEIHYRTNKKLLHAAYLTIP